MEKNKRQNKRKSGGLISFIGTGILSFLILPGSVISAYAAESKGEVEKICNNFIASIISESEQDNLYRVKIRDSSFSYIKQEKYVPNIYHFAKGTIKIQFSADNRDFTDNYVYECLVEEDDSGNMRLHHLTAETDRHPDKGEGAAKSLSWIILQRLKLNSDK